MAVPDWPLGSQTISMSLMSQLLVLLIVKVATATPLTVPPLRLSMVILVPASAYPCAGLSSCDDDGLMNATKTTRMITSLRICMVTPDSVRD